MLVDVDAVGKHLFYRWKPDAILHVHLGLYGKFRSHKIEDGKIPEPRGMVRMRLMSKTHVVDLNGPTRCEIISPQQRQAILDRLGPDPLRADANPSKAWECIHASNRPIGALLLDQSIIAGIGNIYRAEVLFLIGVHPELPGNALPRAKFNQLWKLLVKLFAIGVKHNRLITTDPKDVGRPFEKMRQSDRFHIARRATCRRCDGPIRTWTLGARKMFACETCQAKH
jgi:endonuclease-8